MRLRPVLLLSLTIAAFSFPGCGGGGGGGVAAPAGLPAPAGLSASAGVENASLSWGAVPGAASYRVFRGTSPGVTASTGTPFDVTSPPWVDAPLLSGERYYYAVAAVNGAGPGALSGEASVVPAWPPKGAGPDVGQYFDRAIRPPDGQNYDDRSSHPLIGLTDNTLGTLLYGFTENCLGCHYTSGPDRRSNECLKCHFEGGNAPAGNHGDGKLQLAKVTSDGAAPDNEFQILSLADYDAFCLQCHDGGAVSLGGRFPSSARGTRISAAVFAGSRHRAQTGFRKVGCIFCHHPHGRSNAMLVRENGANRGSAWYTAGAGPRRFGVFPSDNTGTYAVYLNATPNANVPYRARNHWADNAVPYLPDAGDDNFYCNKACHNPSYPKDHMVLRDNTTGNYVLTADNVKQYVVDGFVYPKSVNSQYWHVHVSGEIINTDDIVRAYAAITGATGPVYYRYPDGVSGSEPSSYVPANSPLPLMPDYLDGDRDFTDGYVGRGRIRYRFTCSTCHDPHGSPYANTGAMSAGYPDLRMQGARGTNELCRMCHN